VQVLYDVGKEFPLPLLDLALGAKFDAYLIFAKQDYSLGRWCEGS
jgi:hypothetical protein